jgi:hypothetical protein
MSARIRRVGVVSVWLVFSVLAFLDGSITGGLMFGGVGVGFYTLISLMQSRSRVTIVGDTFVIQNWPMRERAFELRDVLKVRQGRGANSVVSEVLMNRPRGAKYIAVWAMDGSRAQELEEMLRAGGKTTRSDAQ